MRTAERLYCVNATATFYTNLRFNYQVGFTTQIVELQPQFIGVFSNAPFTPPSGTQGFWVVGYHPLIPEPTSAAMAGMSLVGMIAVARRRR